MRASSGAAAGGGLRTENVLWDAAHKTEASLKEVSDSMIGVFRGVEESFQQMKFGTNWWAPGAGGSGLPFSRQVTPPGREQSAASMASDPLAPSRRATPRAPVVPEPPSHTPRGAPAPAAQAAPAKSAATAAAAPPPPAAAEKDSPAPDDAAMRRHFSALERLVAMGLSPQAARVALRHLDAWLVSDAGAAEMAGAEAVASSTGEPILHVGDRVQLSGLVKNTSVNGKVGVLHAYGADSQRWKVILNSGEVYWIRPTLLKPLEERRRSKPAGRDPDPAHGQRSSTDTAALAAGWAKLEEKMAAWKSQQEAREIELLEKEESLRKVQEVLEVEQQLLGQREQSLAMDQARAGLLAVKRQAEDRKQREASGSDMSGAMPAHEVGLDGDDDEVEPVDEDEVWDMDWTALSRGRSRSPARDVEHLEDQDQEDVNEGSLQLLDVNVA